MCTESPAGQGEAKDFQQTGESGPHIFEALMLRDDTEIMGDDLKDHFTYWEQEQVSRIDPFYSSNFWALILVCVSVHSQPLYYDHRKI